jgi:orotate phosphoribosyltransferase
MGFRLEITYCDNRLILSFPAVRNYVRDEFSKILKNNLVKDVIAGVATGAIGIGMLVAESMGTICICSSRAQKHGRQNQVEVFYKKDKMVVVEDLISTNSSLQTVEALRQPVPM